MARGTGRGRGDYIPPGMGGEPQDTASKMTCRVWMQKA